MNRTSGVTAVWSGLLAATAVLFFPDHGGNSWEWTLWKALSPEYAGFLFLLYVSFRWMAAAVRRSLNRLLGLPVSWKHRRRQKELWPLGVALAVLLYLFIEVPWHAAVFTLLFSGKEGWGYLEKRRALKRSGYAESHWESS
ncbi:hypothetical protein GCM10011571_10520 [Marinithermofilum abyssi]|uniref:Uncharacterized protein n=1 Tax=Marinithermofilum abyssi TaxID=1571185 RepID=A0A8J2YDJ3_9BACL|nr:hypothetical protein [Marinithermofilum abyssi]GGE11093.1 hypothetical protein GCM10011571_10520 [Marinithermofilum abyssi]